MTAKKERERESNKRTKRGFSARNFVKQLSPPIFITILKRVLAKHHSNFVSYSSWEQAEQASDGYDSDSLIEKVRKAAKLVFDGEAVYERDSVVFDEIEYSYPLLASLLFAAANSETLRVIDFGGALGTTYQQNRRFLSKLKKACQWRVVEQEKFVSIGKREFTNETLSFYSTIEEAYQGGVDVVLFAGSICYVPNPYIFIEKAKATQVPYVIFDRTPTTKLKEDTFAVQNVPPSIYKASFPIRNFSYDNITKFFKDEYELIEEWVCDLQADPNTTAMGFIFKRKSTSSACEP
jgi:putative methyltransferase (TIGR04325 family)